MKLARNPPPRHRRTLLAVLLVAALTLLAAPALAQEDEGDPNTVEQCEEDHEGRELTEGGTEVGPVFQALCPITANLHIRGLLGALAEPVMLLWLVLWVIPIVSWIGVVLWRVLPRGFLKVKAVRKVEEVNPGHTASFALTVQNRRKRRPADVELSVTRPPKGWSASLAVERPLPSGFKELLGEDEAMRVPLTARKVGANVADVRVLLRAPTSASEEDSCEVDLAVIPYLKDEPSLRRAKEARLVALVRPLEAHPVIKHVEHDPQAFRVQDRITTTVHLENQGEGVLEDLPVRLFVNGEEVASKDIRIPGRSETLVELPWNAPSDECRVRVVIGNE